MGATHSKTKRFRQRSTNSSIETISPVQSTPDLSRSSSTINSRATSIIGDCVHKILGKPRPVPIETDEKEQDRSTNTHFVLKHYFGDNLSAPVHDLLSKPTVSTRVLDVACGYGVWVLEMATNYPHTEVYGIDAACLYPNTIKPSNAKFQQCDMLDPEGFPYPNEYFDYIHMRLVYNCFSASDLKFVLNEMNRVLKPGGYIEIRDIDPIIKNPGPVTDAVFSDFATRMYKVHSIDVTWTKRSGEILKNEIQLTDVHYQHVSVGFDQGLDSVNCSFLDTIKSYKDYIMKTYEMNASEYEETLECITKECIKYRSYFEYYMSWGRKPLVPGNWIKTDASILSQQPDEILAHDILCLTQGFTE